MPLGTRQTDLIGIYHHHEIPYVQMGTENGLVFSSKNCGDFGG
jgi:hypothetical protein